MATYLYLRVSTDKQTTDNQEFDLLRRYPDGVVHQETASGVKSRPVLRRLVKDLKSGDTLVVAALDRLGRKTSEILALIEDLEKRGVILKSIREGVDYSTPVGRLITQVLVSVSELERNLIAERTRVALRALKAKGVQLGRPRIYKGADYEKAIRMREAGSSYKEIQAATGMSMWMISQIVGTPRPPKEDPEEAA